MRLAKAKFCENDIQAPLEKELPEKPLFCFILNRRRNTNKQSIEQHEL